MTAVADKCKKYFTKTGVTRWDKLWDKVKSCPRVKWDKIELVPPCHRACPTLKPLYLLALWDIGTSGTRI